jgi:hypothetical protein
MVENFSWVTNKQDNFKEYVLNLGSSSKRRLFHDTVSNPDGAGAFFSKFQKYLQTLLVLESLQIMSD